MKVEISNHWLVNARHCVSPNQDDRPDVAIDTIVIHNISLPPGQYGAGHIDELFTNCLIAEKHDYFAQICHLQVSAHVLIDRHGN
ncbi:MAG: 1,6-anhydro-N-acetylmuramyl-L-alanine amidase AmpD, partial [Pseudomonadota bacterium]